MGQATENCITSLRRIRLNHFASALRHACCNFQLEAANRQQSVGEEKAFPGISRIHVFTIGENFLAFKFHEAVITPLPDSVDIQVSIKVCRDLLNLTTVFDATIEL
jgi:hypothetical protein